MNLRTACRNWAMLALLAAIPCAAGDAPGGTKPGVSDAGTGRVIELRILDRKPLGGVRTVRAQQGESIVLRVRCNEQMTIHVHGYDVQHRVTADKAVDVAFTARWVGRFSVTAHPPAAQGTRHPPEHALLYLEVHPE